MVGLPLPPQLGVVLLASLVLRQGKAGRWTAFCVYMAVEITMTSREIAEKFEPRKCLRYFACTRVVSHTMKLIKSSI